jgi:hypothetical protein
MGVAFELLLVKARVGIRVENDPRVWKVLLMSALGNDFAKGSPDITAPRL